MELSSSVALLVASVALVGGVPQLFLLPDSPQYRGPFSTSRRGISEWQLVRGSRALFCFGAVTSESFGIDISRRRGEVEIFGLQKQIIPARFYSIDD
jgi:hypothetical protein